MNSVQTESRVHKSLFSRWGYVVLIALAIILSAICSVLVYRESQIAGLPDIGDPFDVTAFTAMNIPNEENAFIDYEKAVSLMVPSRKPIPGNELDLARENGWGVASSTVRDWANDNKAALDTWRLGTSKPAAIETNLLMKYGVSADMSGLRQLFRLATIEAFRTDRESGHKQGWEVHRAILRYSRHVGMHGTLITRLVGMAIFKDSAPSIARWSRQNSVDEALLRNALRDLAASSRMTSPLERTIKWEYVVTQKLLIDYIDDISDFAERLQRFLKHEPEKSVRLLQHDTALELSRIDKLAYTAVTTTPGGVSEAELDRFAADSELVPMRDIIDRMKQSIRREEATQRMLEMTFAAEIFRRANSKYPTSIDQITAILRSEGLEAPVDPFTTSREPLRFFATDDRFIVWSVGEDGIDNSGDHILTTGVSGADETIFVEPAGKKPLENRP